MADNVRSLIGKHGAEVEGLQRWNAEGAEIASLRLLLRRKRHFADLAQLEFRARDCSQRVADAVPLCLDEFRRAVEVEVAGQEGQPLGLGGGVELIHVDARRIVQDGGDRGIQRLGRSGLMSGEGGRAGGRARKIPQALYDFALLEPADDVDERNDVPEPWDRDDTGGEVLRRRHEPQTHLGHDAVVRLLEQPIDARAETRLELLPGLSARHSTHTGAHHSAVRQDHLNAALGLEMVAVGCERHADAAVQRIAQHTAPARARDVDPEL